MFFLQPEVSLIVIKVVHHFKDLEGLFIMALAAILAKPVLMGVFMAAGAIGIWNVLELLEFFPVCHGNLMTFQTCHILMLSQELKFRGSMIEPGGRGKCVGDMAGQAIRRKCFPVVVGMAIQAGSPGPQPGVFPGLQPGIGDVF